MVALLMSGDTRHFWYCLPSIYKYVIEPNNADVFVYVNENSCCSYKHMSVTEAVQRKQLVNQEDIFRDCFGDHLKQYKTPDLEYKQELEYLVNKYKEKTKDYTSDAPMIWYYKDDNKPYYLIDEWLKVKKCSEMISGYDVVVKIRPDISWVRKKNFKKYGNGFYMNTNFSKFLWAKDYLFCGGEKIMKKVCSEFVYQIGDNLDTCINGDDDLTLTNEILFGKYIEDNNIECKELKSRDRDVSRKDITLTGLEPYYHIYNGETNIINNYIEG